MNRKKGIIAFIMLLAFTYAHGQDKIVTIQKDTIYCKIVSISLKLIKFEQQDNNRTTISASIPIEQVKEYSLGSRSQETSPQTKTYTPVKQMENPFPRWRLGFQGGGSYLFNSLESPRQAMRDLGVPAQQVDYFYNQLRKGKTAGADIYYLITNSFGVGLKYSYFTSSVLTSYSVETADNANVTEQEKFFMHYAGPSFFFRQWLSGNHKFSLNEEISVGYILYSDKTLFDPSQYLFINPQTNDPQQSTLTKGNNFSGTFQLSLEYYPLSWLSISLNGGFVPVIFRSLKTSDNGNAENTVVYLGKENQLNLSRIDYSLGVRFHF